jgi:hypothetical protein
MASAQASATGTLKRKLAVFGIALIGVGILLHFTLPWFDFPQLIGWVFGFAVDYPKVAAIPVGILILFFAMAAVDDRFS